MGPCLTDAEEPPGKPETDYVRRSATGELTDVRPWVGRPSVGRAVVGRTGAGWAGTGSLGRELSAWAGTTRVTRAGTGRAATGQAGSGSADHAGAGLTDAMQAVCGRAELSGWWTWGRVGRRGQPG